MPLRRSALSVCPCEPLGDTPPTRSRKFAGPCKAPKGINTQVTSAQGHFRAYPKYAQAICLPHGPARTSLQRNTQGAVSGGVLTSHYGGCPNQNDINISLSKSTCISEGVSNSWFRHPCCRLYETQAQRGAARCRATLTSVPIVDRDACEQLP